MFARTQQTVPGRCEATQGDGVTDASETFAVWQAELIKAVAKLPGGTVDRSVI